MRNVISVIANSEKKSSKIAPQGLLPCGMIGLLCWGMTLLLPFLSYGKNTFFFFLFTWPLFLALLPVAVLVGTIFGRLTQGKLLRTVLLTLLVVTATYWLLFCVIIGWPFSLPR